MATVNQIEYVRYTPEPHEVQYGFKPVFVMRVFNRGRKPQLREFQYDEQLDDGRTFVDAFWPEYARRNGLNGFSQAWYKNGGACEICEEGIEHGVWCPDSIRHNPKCYKIYCHECWTANRNKTMCPNCNRTGVESGHYWYAGRHNQDMPPLEEMQVIELIDYE
jgi:hypothetical protein